jgi:hypothetical protein
MEVNVCIYYCRLWCFSQQNLSLSDTLALLAHPKR